MEELEKNKILGKNQHRYVLFVGNIPYDTQKENLKQHFEKCGQIKHIRIPTEKNTSKPRGFAYVELENADTYQVSAVIFVKYSNKNLYVFLIAIFSDLIDALNPTFSFPSPYWGPYLFGKSNHSLNVTITL